MKKKILIDANFTTETRVVIADSNNKIESVEYSTLNKPKLQGNIYLAVVSRVESSLQAAFIDYGGIKSGFLPFNEIHAGYYNIPDIDKEKVSSVVSCSYFEDDASSTISQNESSGKISNNVTDISQNDIEPSVMNQKYKTERVKYDNVATDAIPIRDFDNDVHSTYHDDNDTDIEEIKRSEAAINTKYKYKIHEVIRKGQVILVQAIKEERGSKGAVFSTYLALAGKYCVLMPNQLNKNGVSKKIASASERKRLKDLLDSLNVNDEKAPSIIARTAALGSTEAELAKDYRYLVKTWNLIRDITLKSQAPAFIHKEEDIILKAVRDMADRHVTDIVVQGQPAYDACVKFMKEMSPNNLKIIKQYNEKIPIFTYFGIEEQLCELYQPRVNLPSGGYIIINPTEALISIDVNSGKSTNDRDIEKMALSTNVEAATEIAKQMRLRELSGLIVIDFIDMCSTKNRKIVEKHFKECVLNDKARVHFNQISNFGILEVSRQRMKHSFSETYTSICENCCGKGIVRSNNSNAMLILRTIENEIYEDRSANILNVFAVPDIIAFILNQKRNEISMIENKYKIKIDFYIDNSLKSSDTFSIEKIMLKHDVPDKTQKPILQNDSYLTEDPLQPSDVEKRYKNKNSRKKILVRQ